MKLEHYIQIFSSLVTFAGVVVALLQLRRILRSVRIGQQGNDVNVITHCANRYEKIISEIRVIKTKGDEGNWYYRYWDLVTEEFNFFRKSMLDPDIFELWINELATVYRSSPKEGMQTRTDSHRVYLNSTLPYYRALREFFAKLDSIAEDPILLSRAKQVHTLIVEFAPKNAHFEKNHNR